MRLFTPGPWEVVRRGNKLPEIIGPERALSDDERQRFGAGPGAVVRPVVAKVSAQFDKANANAQLIAAAPELLAACGLMASTLMGFSASELTKRAGEIHPASFNKAQETMWAAIAKATE